MDKKMSRDTDKYNYKKQWNHKQKKGQSKKQVNKMEKKDELYWGDRERIIRAEEIREKNEKIRLSH